MAFLNDYTLLDELGQGGFATVYKVQHNKLGYIRAIRVLNSLIAHGEDDPLYQKFLSECAVLLRLGNGTHPSIVRIYQPLLRDQRALVEMDFIDGCTTTQYLQNHNGFVPAADVIRLAKEIGDALAYCHVDIYKYCMDKEADNLQDDPNDGSKLLLDEATVQRLIAKYRIIHNDIHSGNIMRREDGRYVLLDFGLSIEGNDVIRSSKRRNGAPEFKSLEKWENELVLSTESDIYSFGVVLYEMLAGQVPFVFDRTMSNIAKAEYLLGEAVVNEKPKPIEPLRRAAFERNNPGETYQKDYPDWLEELIMKCLAKRPTDRFANGKELVEFINSNETIDDKSSFAQENQKLQQEILRLRQEILSIKSKVNQREKKPDTVSVHLNPDDENIKNWNRIKRISVWTFFITLVVSLFVGVLNYYDQYTSPYYKEATWVNVKYVNCENGSSGTERLWTTTESHTNEMCGSQALNILLNQNYEIYNAIKEKGFKDFPKFDYLYFSANNYIYGDNNVNVVDTNYYEGYPIDTLAE